MGIVNGQSCAVARVLARFRTKLCLVDPLAPLDETASIIDALTAYILRKASSTITVYDVRQYS